MELQLGLALSTHSRAYDQPFSHKKRTFSQLMMMEHAPPPHHVMLPTLSLLPLTPSHHVVDDHHSQCSNITKYVLLGLATSLSLANPGLLGWVLQKLHPSVFNLLLLLLLLFYQYLGMRRRRV